MVTAAGLFSFYCSAAADSVGMTVDAAARTIAAANPI